MCGLTNQQKCAMLVNKQPPLHRHHTDSILSYYNVYDIVSIVIFNNGVNIVSTVAQSFASLQCAWCHLGGKCFQ